MNMYWHVSRIDIQNSSSASRAIWFHQLELNTFISMHICNIFLNSYSKNVCFRSNISISLEKYVPWKGRTGFHHSILQIYGMMATNPYSTRTHRTGEWERRTHFAATVVLSILWRISRTTFSINNKKSLAHASKTEATRADQVRYSIYYWNEMSNSSSTKYDKERKKCCLCWQTTDASEHFDDYFSLNSISIRFVADVKYVNERTNGWTSKQTKRCYSSNCWQIKCFKHFKFSLYYFKFFLFRCEYVSLSWLCHFVLPWKKSSNEKL